MDFRLTKKRVFVSDCEGPISKNDNAFELASHFIPDGDSFFALISKYDDVLADIVRRPDYRAGYTLKLITPFLKTYGATNEGIEEYSSNNLVLLAGAKEMLRFVRETLPSYIVSTSYEQYITSFCSVTGFSYENVYCTKLDLDKYVFSRVDIQRLKRLREEISSFPMIEIPEGAHSIKDFLQRDQKIMLRLNRIFWEEIPSMVAGKIFEAVRPVGDSEKAGAVLNIAKNLVTSLDNVIYVGDSITDVSALRLVRNAGGLAISFNGNGYAVRAAEVAVLSSNAIITSIIVDKFVRFGKSYVIKIIEEGGLSKIENYSTNKKLINSFLALPPKDFPQVELVTQNNEKRLIEESCRFRKTVRGEAVGSLG